MTFLVTSVGCGIVSPPKAQSILTEQSYILQSDRCGTVSPPEAPPGGNQAVSRERGGHCQSGFLTKSKVCEWKHNFLCAKTHIFVCGNINI